jgi:hypothetical protein
MNKLLVIAFVFVLFLSACGKSNQVSPTPQPPIKETVLVTKIVLQTMVKEVVQTVVKVVTATPNVPPTATVPPPTPTIDKTTTDKKEGVYLVGSEVALGKWRASGDCYEVLKDDNGEQLDMATGDRSIINIDKSGAYTVEFISFPANCTWSYLGR